MKKLETVISLHGKQSGYVLLKNNGIISAAQLKGAPVGSILYVVDSNSRNAVRFSEITDISSVVAVIVTIEDKSGERIIMHGSARGAKVDLKELTQRHRMKLNAQTQSKQSKENSAALKGILEEASKLFGETRTDEESGKADAPQNSPNSFNPFRQTFPDSVWKKIPRRNGRGFYLEGVAKVGSETLHIDAIPGDITHAFTQERLEKNGFTRFIRSESGRGYLMRVKIIPKH